LKQADTGKNKQAADDNNDRIVSQVGAAGFQEYQLFCLEIFVGS